MKKKLIAEGFGTFALALAVLTSVNVDSVLATPVIAGLVLGLFVYTIGSNSGCHINPAVTAGLWSIGKINSKDAMSYIASQLAGGLVAFFVASAFIPGLSLGTDAESMMVFFAELIGMVVFTFGIASVVYKKAEGSASGLIIGGSLMLGIIIAVHLGSAGLLNPAVGLAVGSLSFSYVLGAVAGSAIGMRLFKMIST
ncbi:aquaporin [Candidatus Kaiserbacteria bacterium]|nr:aquaporin [Candidatus Kaiserbacteria bacterium]